MEIFILHYLPNNKCISIISMLAIDKKFGLVFSNMMQIIKEIVSV